MKYANIADIHANLGALHAVLRDAEQQGCTHTACLGDIVGYYDKPKECLDIIRGMNIPCVKGNHDQYCSEELPVEGFKPEAVEVVQWTRQQLTEDDRRWLRSLPLVQVVAGFTIVHGSLYKPERWEYVFDRFAAASSLEYQGTPVCFFGHTHVPLAFVRDSVVRGGTYSKFRVESGKHYFVNTGSVGQPRDGDKRAAYVVYDLDEASIELRRIEAPPADFPPLGDGGVRMPRPPGGPKPKLSEAKEFE
jgi:predicted phosphodiesterase